MIKYNATKRMTMTNSLSGYGSRAKEHKERNKARVQVKSPGNIEFHILLPKEANNTPS